MRCVAATVDAMAMPIAAPSCWAVLSSPEASLASCLATPARPAIEMGTKPNAAPAPATKNGPARAPQKCPCTGACVAHRTPPPISAIPAAITGPAEKRVTSIGASPASATEVTEAASQASPAYRAE